MYLGDVENTFLFFKQQKELQKLREYFQLELAGLFQMMHSVKFSGSSGS